MTISSTTIKSGPYSGNGATTVFNYTFKIKSAAELEVVSTDADGVETILVQDTDYDTITGVGNSNGGTFTMASAPATGTTITPYRRTARTQATSLRNQGGYVAEQHETAWDKLTAIVQEMQEEIDRSVKVDISSGDDPADFLTDIETARDDAQAAASAAATSETNAASSASSASSSASTATTKASEAATSATAAASSASSASTSASTATTKASDAATSATAAAASATAAAASASTATTQASNASTSATTASSAATAASAAQVAAEAALASTLAAYDAFDDRYLGAKAADPTVDNDGNALVAGALYYKTTATAGMYVYTGSAWVAAYISGAGYLAAANNLSDVANAASARTNLGLGTVATKAAPSGSSILKGDGSGGFSNAVASTDYAPATSGSGILKGNGSGGFSAASAGTDYADNAFKTIAVSGQSNVVADSASDTLTLVGSGVTITTDASTDTITFTAASGLPTNHISGLQLSNSGVDATNDIVIAAGKARSADDTEDMVLAASITKQLDAAWAVGTNQGGRDTGSISDTLWAVWLIKRTDTNVVDVLFSTSFTAPTMPTNYTKKRLIGAILRKSSAIIPFAQTGNEFFYSPASAIYDISSTSSYPWTSTTVSVPPYCVGRFTLNASSSTDCGPTYYGGLARMTGFTVANGWPFETSNSVNGQANFTMKVNGSRQIDVKGETTGSNHWDTSLITTSFVMTTRSDPSIA